MRILLIGEYSNVHATLALALRRLGHQVTVVSNGDFWKNYPRDIDVSRPAGHFGGLRLMLRVASLLNQFERYDVVQLINPMFLELKARRLEPIYRYLCRHNAKVFLGAFGMDYYWVHENITRKPLRYSDFNIGQTLRTDPEAMKQCHDWIGTDKERLNRYIAGNCDGIIAGLYEYWACYQPLFPDKTTFIPYPIRPAEYHEPEVRTDGKLRLLIGISRNRSAYKGTDIMLEAAKAMAKRYPDRISLRVVEGLPFSQYLEELDQADALLDQLYSYTPAMNGLEAMNRGVICIGGGETENYDILGERELRPILNVEPNYDSVCRQIAFLAEHPDQVPLLKRQSHEYIVRHHDYLKVAQAYLKFWKSH